MSNSNHISKEAQADSLFKLTKAQKDNLEVCREVLEKIIKDDIIDETSLRNLTSVYRELDTMRELFLVRIMNSLKRGDMLLS